MKLALKNSSKPAHWNAAPAASDNAAFVLENDPIPFLSQSLRGSSLV